MRNEYNKKIFILGYIGYYNLGDDLMIKILSESFPPKSKITYFINNNYYNNNSKNINRATLPPTG